MTLKIQRSIKRDNAIFNLCGQIDAKELPELRRLLAAEEQGYVVLDLKEVKLIDREALGFLARCEENGINIENCPAYIREWLLREGKTNGNPDDRNQVSGMPEEF
jgi:ABC-type transporter Mla MlaB component